MTQATFRFCSRGELIEEWPRVAPHVKAIADANPNPDYSASDLRDLLARGIVSLLVMESESGGSLLGFAVLHELPYPRRRYLSEAHIWILPEHRGSGIFAQYLTFIRQWAVANGYQGTSVPIDATDDANWHPLMTEHGFVPRTVEYVWESPVMEGAQ